MLSLALKQQFLKYLGGIFDTQYAPLCFRPPFTNIAAHVIAACLDGSFSFHFSKCSRRKSC